MAITTHILAPRTLVAATISGLFFSLELLIVRLLFELERGRAGKGEGGAEKGFDWNFRQPFW